MTNVDALLESTARACARGTNQLSFVNELLAYRSIYPGYEQIPGKGYGLNALRWGGTRLCHGSWINLRKRLVVAGFIVVRLNDPYGVRLDHPARRGY